LGIEDAEHEETAPNASNLLISKLTCSLTGKTQTIKILPGSAAHQAYGCDEVKEQFACSYGVNPQFRDKIEQGHLKITGIDFEGGVKVVEVTNHPFYIATLFLPQISSSSDNPHPLIVANLKAALKLSTAWGG
jgi:CTP synthase (UTP-ammonia lyase)